MSGMTIKEQLSRVHDLANRRATALPNFAIWR